MHSESEDKHHLPTAKRISELRKKGMVMRSRELSAGMVFVIGICALMYMTTNMSELFQNNFTSAFSNIRSITDDDDLIVHQLKIIALNNFHVILPILIILLIGAMLSPFLFGGWNFTWDAIRFKTEKLNPFINLKNIFALKRSSVEIFKSMLKAIFILTILACFVYQKMTDLTALTTSIPLSAMKNSYYLGESFIVLLSVALVFLVAFDVLQNYFQFQNQAKMSSQELKEEHRESEGNADVKRKYLLTE